ncbi:PREDICTED: uncharacterized protein LOC108548191 [Eufriesea mexicana]|uniref:uncharacterized protein LOC108548191 n=1 Tax=Eufriesea mexicana TaxID=516756 RepID=UPI00083C7543|nr:PREDICTED: uncharacterized protein LOC108548191 [Eufriesea mexicana]
MGFPQNGSPAAALRVLAWRVADELETFSDHLHILLNITAYSRSSHESYSGNVPSPPRWALGRLNQDALMAAVHAVVLPERTRVDCTAQEGAEWFRWAITSVCDVAMPRAGEPPTGSVYWWSHDISHLRAQRVLARRSCTRARRRRRTDGAETALQYKTFR